MAGVSLREITIPRFALRHDEAAASLGISPSTFASWVKEGLMPKGKKIGGVVLYDTEKIRAHWYRLNEVSGDPPNEASGNSVEVEGQTWGEDAA